MIRKQLTVCLQNKPGALARATRAVAKANANIEAISVVEKPDVGLVRMVVSDPRAASKAMDQLGIPCVIENVAVLSLDDRPGRLSALAAGLADAGVEISGSAEVAGYV